MKRLVPLACVFTLLLVGQALSATTFDVHVGGVSPNAFVPADISVTPGDTVHFVNDGGGPAGGFYNVTFQDGPASISPFSSYDRMFTHVGTFLYRCTIHSTNFTDPGTMHGSVSVAGIGGQVIEDADGHGVKDAGETGISGVSVQLSNSGGPVSATTTDSSGYYAFGTLPTDATYTVTYTVPAGYSDTGFNSPIHVNYTAGAVAAGNDFLAKPTGDINGQVVGDSNANGALDAGETSLSGVLVFIDANHDGSAQSGERSAVTDGAGYFDLPRLRAGTYRLSYVVPPSFDNSGALPRDVTLTPGQTQAGINFFAASGTAGISGTVFHDSNGNAAVDAGEQGIQGVVVGLDRTGDGSPDSLLTTDVNGAFAFTGLPSGTYRVLLNPSSGLESTGPGAYDVSLSHGQGVSGRDFFLRQPGEGARGTGGDAGGAAGGGNLPGVNAFVQLPKPFGQGSSGPDTIRGTPGPDKLYGFQGNDRLFGMGGNDLLDGSSGNDYLDGGPGADHLVGASGSDREYGGAGNDRLFGGSGSDRLVGGPGDDQVDAGSGTDYVSAGPGNDTVNARDGTRDTIDCGPGEDSARVDRIDRVRNCEHVTRF